MPGELLAHWVVIDRSSLFWKRWCFGALVFRLRGHTELTDWRLQVAWYGNSLVWRHRRVGGCMHAARYWSSKNEAQGVDAVKWMRMKLYGFGVWWNGQRTRAAADAEPAGKVGETGVLVFCFAINAHKRPPTSSRITHLADHGGSGAQPGSLDALVGPLASEAGEELQTVDGFPSFG